MFSFATAFLASLVYGPASPPQCTCPESLYPDLSTTNVDHYTCQLCSNLKSATDGVKVKPELEEAPSPLPRPPRTKDRAKSPPIEPTERKAAKYLNRQLTESLSSIADKPVLICRTGALVVFENGESLHDYQATDVQRILNREAAGKSTILAYSMGLGKTVTSAAVISSRQSVAPGVFPTTLVIAPSVGILQHWMAELKRFVPKLKVLLYHGDGLKKDPRKPDVTLVTLHQVRHQYAISMNDLISDESKFPLYTGTFHRVIIDEAQTIRNPETASAKASWALKKSYGLCLTGTPAQNSVRDLQAIIKFSKITTEGLDDLRIFDARITNPYKRGEIVKATELLVRVLTECMIYRPKESAGVVQLPKRHDPVILRRDLTPAELAVYVYIRDVHPFRSYWAKAVRLRQAVDHPALLTKALHRGDIGPKPDETSDQMRVLLDKSTADADKVIEEDKPLETLPPSLLKHAALFESTFLSTKLKALWDVLKRIPKGEKVIIFTHFVTNLDIMADSLREHRVPYAKYDGRMSTSERSEALDQIHTDKNCTVLLLSIMAGGTGLDIPSCNHVILVEPWWNPYVEEQAISRVHRIGQVREVRIYRLLVNNSIEDSIVKTQAAKREVVGGLLSLCTVPNVEEMRKWLA
ncbi:P-loop containing nucleoside triphosphate hydrolase protein [Mycena crocata]|nr:P-loop containing nucleoside triphosphate hydrolase protein [Mycena crocata]